MTKYHVNPETGRANICHGDIRGCQFGDNMPHYDSKDAARAGYEDEMASDTIQSLSKATNATQDVTEVDEEVDTQNEYDFPADRLGSAINRIEIANRKAERAGIEERFEYTTETYMKSKKDNQGFDTYEERVKLVLNRPTLQHDGWNFAGTMSWDEEAGLITRMAPDQELISKPKASLCDVCKKVRHRTDTYIVQKDGEQFQVGSNCLKRFMGIKPSGLWMMDFDLEVKEGHDDFASEGGSNARERRSSLEMVSIGLAVVENNGWVSRSAAQYGDKTATADHVDTFLHMIPKTVEHRNENEQLRARAAELKEEAEEILEEAKNIEGDGDYAQNLRALANSETVTSRNVPLLLSAIAAKHKNDERKIQKEVNKTSVWIGTKGEKLPERSVTVENIKHIDNNFGYNAKPSRLVTMRDNDGNVFKTFYSGNAEIEDGTTYNLKSSTVKDHKEWNDVKETMLTRIKLEADTKKEPEDG